VPKESRCRSKFTLGRLVGVSEQIPAEPPQEHDEIPEQMRIRRAKREALLEAGTEPYPLGYPRTATLREIRAKYTELPVDHVTGDVVATTGRVMFQRNTGKLCFATLQDGDGTQLQVMLSLDRVGAERLEDWKRLVDLGDHVGVTGEVISS